MRLLNAWIRESAAGCSAKWHKPRLIVSACLLGMALALFTLLWPASSTASGWETYALSGRVTKGDAGLAGVSVTLTGDYNASTTTLENGLYVFFNIPYAAHVSVVPSVAGHYFFPSSNSMSVYGDVMDIDFHAAPQGSFYIDGTISAGCQACRDATVRLIDDTGATLDIAKTWGCSAFYRVVGAPAGANVKVIPNKPGYSFSPTYREYQNIARSWTNQDFQAYGSGSAGSSSSASGLTVSGQVKMGSSGDSWLSNVLISANGYHAISNSHGDYTLSGLAAGSYTLTGFRPDFQVIPRSFSNPLQVGQNLSGVDFQAATEPAASFGYSSSASNTSSSSFSTGSSSSSIGSNFSSLNSESSHSAISDLPLSECQNGLDDDANGLIDFPADSGCSSHLDATESPASENGCQEFDLKSIKSNIQKLNLNFLRQGNKLFRKALRSGQGGLRGPRNDTILCKVSRLLNGLHY